MTLSSLDVHDKWYATIFSSVNSSIFTDKNEGDNCKTWWNGLITGGKSTSEDLSSAKTFLHKLLQITKTVKVVQTQLSMKFWGWERIIQSNHMNTKANIEEYYNNNFRYRTLPARLWKKWLICIHPMLQQDKIWHVIFQNWPQNTTMSLSTYKDCHSLNSTFLTWHYGLLYLQMLPDNSILIFVSEVISFSFLFELLTGYVSWLWSEIR